MPIPSAAMGQSAHGVNFSQGGIAITPANASAQFRFIDRVISGVTTPTVQSAPTSAVFSDQFMWLTGAGQSADYWVRVTPTSGSFSGGDATGTWLQLNATRTWARNRTSNTPGTTSVTATVEIASENGGPPLVSFSVTLSATVAS